MLPVRVLSLRYLSLRLGPVLWILPPPIMVRLARAANVAAASASSGERQAAAVQSPAVIRSAGQVDTSPQPSGSVPVPGSLRFLNN